MSWIKLDNKAPRHPKIASLTDRAFRWWVLALCYAGEFLTDGVLPPVFWKEVPKQTRAELTGNMLWDWDDPNFQIHDYHHHQQRKEDVEDDKERNRQNAKAYRERRKEERRKRIVTDDASPKTNLRVIAESPTQITDTDIDTDDREETKSSRRGLIVSPEYYARRIQHCAFVGSRIEVPNGLHADLRRSHGGPDPEKELQDWYLELNEKAEVDQWRIPQGKDFFPWFKSLYGQKFPIPAAVKKPWSVAEAVQRTLDAEAVKKAGAR
jgi:hypothetical protein